MADLTLAVIQKIKECMDEQEVLMPVLTAGEALGFIRWRDRRIFESEGD